MQEINWDQLKLTPQIYLDNHLKLDDNLYITIKEFFNDRYGYECVFSLLYNSKDSLADISEKACRAFTKLKNLDTFQEVCMTLEITQQKCYSTDQGLTHIICEFQVSVPAVKNGQ